MKEITATCEKEFVQKLALDNQRLDGRSSEENRKLNINFGSDRGCVLVSLGNTCVLSQVSCELSEPRTSRPSEGQLHVNVELSPMAAPNIDIYRSSEITSSGEYSRLLERCIRDSRCIDLESLCVVSGEKVWNIRVDVHVLNHDGNISECASIAAVTSLSHFRRPDVTVLGADVTVHTVDERDPVPLSLLQMPFCTSLAVVNDGESLIIDPLEVEERVSTGSVIIGLNIHQEVCLLHLGGKARISKENVLKATSMAFRRVQKITEEVKSALAEDAVARSSGKKVGFSEVLQSDKLLRTRHIPETKPEDIVMSTRVKEEMEEETPTTVPEVLIKGKLTTLIGEGGPSQWDTLDMEEPVRESTRIINEVKKLINADGSNHSDDSSEEEETVTLQKGIDVQEKRAKGKRPKTNT